MLSEESNSNEKRRSLTFADKFEVKFFFKAEAPREIAFCETSFTTGGDENYYEDDDYWDPEDDYYDEEDDYYDDENQEDYYYDEEEDYDHYNYNYNYNYNYDYRQRNYSSYSGYDYDDEDDYYDPGVNFSIRYERSVHDDLEEEMRSRPTLELFSGFGRNEEQNDSERSNTRRLALAKLEKGLFRRQQQRDMESYSETEESEASTSNSESDPFDEPLPHSTSAAEDYLINDHLRKSPISPVTIKATFTTTSSPKRDMPPTVPMSIPIPNHRSRKSGLGLSQSFDQWNKQDLSVARISDCFKPSSLTIYSSGNNHPLVSSLKDTLFTCSPLAILNESPVVVNSPTTMTKESVADLWKSSTLSTKTNPVDFQYVPTLNTNDLVKKMTNSHLLSSSKSKSTTETTTTSISSLLNSLSNNSNSTNSKGTTPTVKKRMRSYSSPSSFQQLLPCY